MEPRLYEHNFSFPGPSNGRRCYGLSSVGSRRPEAVTASRVLRFTTSFTASITGRRERQSDASAPRNKALHCIACHSNFLGRSKTRDAIYSRCSTQ